MFPLLWQSIILLLVILLVYRIITNLPAIRPKKRTEKHPLDVMVVLGSGGHTGEIAPLVNALSKSPNYGSFTFIASNTDSLSQKHPLIPKEKSTFLTIPRARNVGQSYFTSIFTTIYSFLACLPLMFRKPQLLLVNGPGVCVPVVISVFIGNVLGISYTSIVYVESMCRVETLSLTGKIIYPLCDLFFVSWPQLLALKKRAKLLDPFGLNSVQKE